MFSRNVPADGSTVTVWLDVCGGTICGGLFQLSVTVTGLPGGKPLARTTNGASAGPRLCFTMHAPGAPPAWPDEPHTVGGAGGGEGSPPLDDVAGALEPLSAEPRMTPITTRAAPTQAQPAQAMCARSHRRQRGPPAAPVPVRPWPGLRRGAGRSAGSSV